MMKVKEESEKVGLKLSIQKTKIIASSLITSLKIDRKNNRNSGTAPFGRQSDSFFSNHMGQALNSIHDKWWKPSGRLYFGGLRNHCR